MSAIDIEAKIYKINMKRKLRTDRQKLDFLLLVYKRRLSHVIPDRFWDAVAYKLVAAGTNHTAYKILVKRLQDDGMIVETDPNVVSASSKALGFSYVNDWWYELGKTILRFASSLVITVGAGFAMYYSYRQTTLQETQVNLQCRDSSAQVLRIEMLKTINQQQKQIEVLSKKECPQPTVVVNNYIKQK